MGKVRGIAVATALALLGGACVGTSGEGRTVVASFYPLAYAARRITGPGWEVIDLTPPGTEAHDVELSLDARAAIEEADLVLYLGDIGFQPQVERAAEDAEGRVAPVSMLSPDLLRPSDPHFWLDPAAYSKVVGAVVQEGFEAVDHGEAAVYRDRAADLRADLLRLDRRYREGLQDCRFQTMIVSHEAFGYLADRYGLRQLGLAGISPEGEPTADRLERARALIRSGEAGAMFYEETDEARRVAESFADDNGVPALPLSTLESEPANGDYLSVMERNLESLREGLGCR